MKHYLFAWLKLTFCECLCKENSMAQMSHKNEHMKSTIQGIICKLYEHYCIRQSLHPLPQGKSPHSPSFFMLQAQHDCQGLWRYFFTFYWKKREVGLLYHFIPTVPPGQTGKKQTGWVVCKLGRKLAPRALGGLWSMFPT